MWVYRNAQSDGNPLLHTLNGHQGRQTWEYSTQESSNKIVERQEQARSAFRQARFEQKHSKDELLRLQMLQSCSASLKAPTETPRSLSDAIQSGMAYFSALQQPDGHWAGDYGGPMFLMPGLIITCYITGSLKAVLTSHHQQEMIRYLENHQNKDGGWGLHIEGPSTMFGTALNYVSLRILGRAASAAGMPEARAWMHARGGAHWSTSWGKVWLAVLGLMEWEGVNPLTPEMWLLPFSKWSGIGWAHPGRFWCHCRMVYLPMSYLYGIRARCQETPLISDLRQELYPMPYESISWNAMRNCCAKEDMYYPHPALQNVLWWVMSKAETLLLGSGLRQAALKECMKLIHYEDESTRYLDIGPVNKVLNMLACWFEDPQSEQFARHLPRLHDYLWLAEDGMKMQGYNGSQLWDTAFAVQAFAASGMAKQFSSSLQSAHRYIRSTQVQVEAAAPLDRFYRHPSKGAWPFSTQDHGWPISDCTSEGLKAALDLLKIGPDIAGQPVSPAKLHQCVEVILSYQNSCGGWATYEKSRSTALLELINPSETFGDIVIDYPCVECTSACMTALWSFQQHFPEHAAAAIAKALHAGRAYVERVQRSDGSWYGSWGVCFTYGTWFGCEALSAMGQKAQTSMAQQRACKFLLLHQREDGGWGESYLSCQDKIYTQAETGSQVINTAWAMLALMAADQHRSDAKPLHRAAKCLLAAQLPSGDWPQQAISGVFNRNCMITYSNYRNIFPIWALGKYRSLCT
ncbi:hypothetical protein WJX84_004983 [Apatococcus fuscideae]|uniref:Terpene cyclase/mutase family member n=1 Tax=Apatococcus fuscideae TaxID=2026836 RepID=A0AAW1TCA9_9CHLO